MVVRGLASADQDGRFSSKQKREMAKFKAPPEYSLSVDFDKVVWTPINAWIMQRVTELLKGVEDEVLVGTIIESLKQRTKAKELHYELVPFLANNTTLLVKELWILLHSASESASGIPARFEQEEADRIRRRNEEQEAALAKMQLARDRQRADESHVEDRRRGMVRVDGAPRADERPVRRRDDDDRDRRGPPPRGEQPPPLRPERRDRGWEAQLRDSDRGGHQGHGPRSSHDRSDYGRRDGGPRQHWRREEEGRYRGPPAAAAHAREVAGPQRGAERGGSNRTNGSADGRRAGRGEGDRREVHGREEGQRAEGAPAGRGDRGSEPVEGRAGRGAAEAHKMTGPRDETRDRRNGGVGEPTSPQRPPEAGGSRGSSGKRKHHRSEREKKEKKDKHRKHKKHRHGDGAVAKGADGAAEDAALVELRAQARQAKERARQPLSPGRSPALVE